MNSVVHYNPLFQDQREVVCKMRELGAYIRLSILFGVPIFASLLPLIVPGKEAKCGYVVIVMALFWISEALPFAVTGLIPVVAFPLLGIVTSRTICMSYLTDTNMLFLGSLMVAVSVEHCQLHKRIALSTLLRIGQTPMRLLLSFMLIQAFLSMWISNTAATAMMVPIAEAILQLFDANDDVANKKTLRDICFLALAYAANLGGTATLTGTNPNLVLMGLLENIYPGGTQLGYATWLAYNVPGMIVCLIIGYCWLSFVLWKNTKPGPANNSESKDVKRLLQQQYEELGCMSFHEKTVISLFLCLVIAWVFKSPKVIPGWGELLEGFFGGQIRISPAVPAMLTVILLFVIPSKNPFKMTGKDSVYKYEGCLNWKVVHEKVPWSVIILIGSGFALAEGSRASGLNDWLSLQFQGLGAFDKQTILITACLATTMLTEVMSNTAAASILLPILNTLALKLEVHPLYFMLPVTLCCSYAFMLPVATPPNAIVFDAAMDMQVSTMVKCGFVMNIISTFVCILMSISYGTFLFGYNEFPDWANTTVV